MMDNFTSMYDVANHTGQSIHSVDHGLDKEAAKLSLFVMVIILQLSVVLGMGCVTTITEIWQHIKQPSGILIAFGSQFGLLPLCAFGLVTVLKLSALHSLSIMILACSPGGTMSNLYAYLSKGDVALSIVLTTVSTALAIGMMPLNLWIYSRPWQVADLKVPYDRIALNLVWILVPLGIGMSIKVFWPKIAAIVAKITSTLATILVIAGYIPQYIANPDSFQQSWKIWFLATFLPFLGFAVGYLSSIIFRRTHPICRTIALETGIQSISLAVAIIMTSFPPELQMQLTPFAFLYGINNNSIGFFVVLSVRLHSCFVKSKKFTHKPELICSTVI